MSPSPMQSPRETEAHSDRQSFSPAGAGGLKSFRFRCGLKIECSAKYGLTQRRHSRQSWTFTHHKPMKKILATLLIFSSIGLGVIAFGVGGSPRPNANADAFIRTQDIDNSSAIVQLKGDRKSVV